MSYHSFEDLEVWKRARTLTKDIYLLTKDLNDWSLRDQMRRAAVSIASNIAEGAERNGAGEFKQFIGIAKGSAAELRTQLYLLKDLSMAPEIPIERLIAETKLLGAKLEALRKKM